MQNKQAVNKSLTYVDNYSYSYNERIAETKIRKQQELSFRIVKK